MSRIVVNLDSTEKQEQAPAGSGFKYAQAPPEKPRKKRGLFGKILKILGVLLVLVLVIGGTGGYFYWQHLRTTPAYSMALIIDAARRDDKEALAKLVDTDKVVDAFVPQITDKAVELYGRGVPPALIQKLSQVAGPIMPALKDRARAELPRIIREKTAAVENVPFFLIALGASQALEIKQEGDVAQVKSTMPDRPLELKVQKNGNVWQIVEIRDEPLARKIAETMGQEIIAAARGAGKSAIPNLTDMLKKAEEAFRQPAPR